MTTVNNWYAGFDSTWQDARTKGHELGNHTVNHCNFNLTGCAKPLATAAAELDDASDYIRTKLHAPGVWTMAYPFGDTGYKALAQARFFLARGTGGGMIAAGDNSDPFNLPCVAAAGGEAAERFNTSIDAAHTQGKWLIFLFHSLLPDAQNWFAGVDIGQRHGQHHPREGPPRRLDRNGRRRGRLLGPGKKTFAAATPTPSGANMT